MFPDTAGITRLFETLAVCEPRLKVVCQEQDDNPGPKPEVAAFLKFDGKRLGRDVDLYAFLATETTPLWVVTKIVEEVIAPLKESSPAAFIKGMEIMRGYDAGYLNDDWNATLDEVAGKP